MKNDQCTLNASTSGLFPYTLLLKLSPPQLTFLPRRDPSLAVLQLSSRPMEIFDGVRAVDKKHVPGTVVILRHLRRFQCCRGTCKPLARVSQTDIMHHLALYPQNMKNTTPVTALTSSWLVYNRTCATNVLFHKR